MDMSKKEYQQFVQDRAKKSPLLKDCILAFLIGGAIWRAGPGHHGPVYGHGAQQDRRQHRHVGTLVFLSVLLTGLNLYNKLGRYGGAGTLVPITGFANAVASPAIDFKSEGLITGMAAKMFTVAGPVIVFGVAASAVYGCF